MTSLCLDRKEVRCATLRMHSTGAGRISNCPLDRICINAIIIHFHENNFANLISKLNFYKLIPYPIDNCFTGRRDRSGQTSEKDVLYIIPAGPARRVHSPGGASYFLFLSRHRDVIASFSCLVLVRPLVS